MAFSVFYRGVSILCLLAAASSFAQPVWAQELELRGTLSDSLPLAENELDPMETGAILSADDGYMEDQTSYGSSSARAKTPAPVPVLALGDIETGRPQRMNQRIPSLQGSTARRNDDPFAATGIRVGTFTLFPTFEQGLTATSNTSDSPNGDGGLISETKFKLRANSDWSRHRVNLSSDLNYQRAISGELEPELSGGVDAELQLDISHSLTGKARLAYAAERESVTSPLAVVGVDQQPLRHRLTGELGLEKTLGPLLLSANGQVSRSDYSAARLNDGTALSQDDQNYTLVLGKLRAGYEVSPALVPFVEIEAGQRVYDETYDSGGYQRSGHQIGARAGVAVDVEEKLSGEVSAGWLSESFDDDRLQEVSGLAIAASVQWSPMRSTNVFMDAGTSLEGGRGSDSGSLLYSSTLRVERQLRSNLTGDLSFGAAWREYQAGGNDLTLHGQASLTWWLNRYAGLVTRVRHERRTSSNTAREYDSSSIFVGVKLQH